jgi:hypothetical protein
MKMNLNEMGIKTAMDQAKIDPWTLRKKIQCGHHPMSSQVLVPGAG